MMSGNTNVRPVRLPRLIAQNSLHETEWFLQCSLDALSSHIAILNDQGVIVAVNEAWRRFANENGGDSSALDVGASYLNVCEDASGDHADEAPCVTLAIRNLVAGHVDSFELEYPCHSPTEQRWFLLRMTRFNQHGPVHIVVQHDNITSRVLAELKILAVNDQLAERVDELKRRTQELMLLADMSDRLQRCSSIDEAHIELATVLPLLFPHSDGRVLFASESTADLRSVAEWGAPFGHAVVARTSCIAIGRNIHVYDDHEVVLGQCDHLRDSEGLTTLCVPMVVQDEVVGLLAFGFHDQSTVRMAQVQLANMVSQQIAMILANLRLRERLREQSIRDPLTGLFNRRYMEESLQREVHRAVRIEKPIGVILLDIDHFKSINDTYGHSTGDEVLRTIARVLGRMIRSEDIACRYGGEEFLLILPGASLEATARRAEAIRAAIEALDVQASCGLREGVTLSCGTAAFLDTATPIAAVLESADAALYRAKRQGRNRVVVEPGTVNA